MTMMDGIDHQHPTPIHQETDRGLAIQRAIEFARAEDIVLIAGKGHEDYQIIDTTKVDFDDRVHAREALKLWLQHQKDCQTNAPNGTFSIQQICSVEHFGKW